MQNNPDNSKSQRTRADFAKLLTQHEGQVFRLIFCMVHKLEDTEDVFQQAALTMWDKFESFEFGSDFVAWASQIARNKALNLLSAKGRRNFCLSQDFVTELAQREEPIAEARDARLQALAKCRGKLAKADQELLLQCYGKSDSIREAAKQVGRTPASVYVSLKRIRHALFECIQRRIAQEVRL